MGLLVFSFYFIENCLINHTLYYYFIISDCIYENKEESSKVNLYNTQKQITCKIPTKTLNLNILVKGDKAN